MFPVLGPKLPDIWEGISPWLHMHRELCGSQTVHPQRGGRAIPVLGREGWPAFYGLSSLERQLSRGTVPCIRCAPVLRYLRLMWSAYCPVCTAWRQI